MKTFVELYEVHKGKVSDKWELYLYTYERIFAPFKLRPILLLEFGVQNGGSLELYAKYFPNAKRIIGCDINPACEKLKYQDSRISLIIGDCNEDKTQVRISEMSEKFDLIIDDGSHFSSEIIQSFVRYFPLLSDSGTYVIEDLHCSYWSEHGGGLYAPYSAISFFKKLIDICNHQHWGVTKSREVLLSGFIKKYQLPADLSFLARINSIEFVNSICIIRKSQKNSALGKRIIVGMDESVVEGRLAKNNSESFPLDQSHNPFSVGLLGIEELWETQKLQILELNALTEDKDRKILELNALTEDKDRKILELNMQMLTLNNRLAVLYKSISWKITSPIRKIKIAFIRFIFRSNWYLENNPDVVLSDMSPWQHYTVFGINEGRSPCPYFQYIKVALLWVRKNGGILSALIKLIKMVIKDGPLKTIKKVKILLFTSSAFDHSSARDYENYIKSNEPIFSDLEEMKCLAIELKYKPLFSITVPVFNVDAKWLIAFIESVLSQVYPFWELCIADDCSTDVHVHEILNQYASQDSRIKVIYRESNGHISAATNSAISLATGEFICLMDNDDEIAPHALYEFASLLNKDTSIDMIYSDEDKIDLNGKRYEPFFKPDWSPETLEGCMYTAHFACYRMSIAQEIGLFRGDYDGAQDYDFVLRFTERTANIAHISKVLYHWRAIPGSTATSMDSKDYVLDSALRALEGRAIRSGFGGSAKLGLYKGSFTLEYALSSTPLVSIIIPSAGKSAVIHGREVDLLSSVVSSIYQKSSYKNIEIIIVDNGDLTDVTMNNLMQYPCKFVSFRGSFNIASKMNMGAKQARGEYLLFMNDDIEVINSSWIESMLQLCQRERIGVVGAKLYFENGLIQHVGVVNVIGVPDHIHRGMPSEYPGYFFSAVSNRNYLAVTGAVMMTKSSIFEKLGGFDINFPINYNDIDYCLRVYKEGYRIVFCAQAELFHYESISRARTVASDEIELFKNRWSEFENSDPYYSVAFDPHPPNFHIRKVD